MVFVTELSACWLKRRCSSVYTLKTALWVFTELPVLVSPYPAGVILQETVWSSNHCQQQLIEQKKASWAFPFCRDFRVCCSICHRPASNSSNLNCYSGSSTAWIQARTRDCSGVVTQIDDLLLSVDRGRPLIFYYPDPFYGVWCIWPEADAVLPGGSGRVQSKALNWLGLVLGDGSMEWQCAHDFEVLPIIKGNQGIENDICNRISLLPLRQWTY